MMILKILCTLMYFSSYGIFLDCFYKACVYIIMYIILCKCQDVLILLKFPRDVFTTYKNVFFISGCWCEHWYLHYYHGNATFNIKLILSIV